MNAANHHLLADALTAAELMGVGAVRSLDLLRDIDGTIDALTHHTALLRAAERTFANVKKALSSGEAAKAIPEGDIIPVLEGLQDSLVKSFSEKTQKMGYAISDPRLSDEDGVVDAYSIFLDAVASLNRTTESLRWAILESNADAEESHAPVILSEPSDIDNYLDSL
ncbi:hypothetical protein [Pseudomonas sp. W5-01]|uniref:hypothetical protein n=1 Tax=Pseudomonas sp. W5-01 TaxID=3097454 RepID=UPI00397B2E0A